MAAQSDGHLSNKHSHSLHETDKEAPTPTCTMSWCWCVQVFKGVTRQRMFPCLPVCPFFPPCCLGCSVRFLGFSSFTSTAELVLYSHRACTTLQVQAAFCWIILLLWPEWGGLMRLSPLEGPHFSQLRWTNPPPRDLKRSQTRLSVWRLIVRSWVEFTSSICKPK